MLAQAEIKSLRQQLAAGAAPEDLYLFGGNNTDWLDSVLVYSPGTNTWRAGEGGVCSCFHGSL